MRASTTTSSLASLAILLSTMTIPFVTAIPAPDKLPATSIGVGAPNPILTSSNTNNPDSTTIKDVAAWDVGCVSHDPTQLGDLTPANTPAIEDGIEYLQKTPGEPYAKEHPVCGQVSCSYNSAIWWCNEDKDQPVTVHGGYKVLAEGVEAIVNRCDMHGTGRVMGKAFAHWGQWSGQKVNVSVIVTGGDC